MSETTRVRTLPSDRPLLRRIRAMPTHAYAIAQELAAEGGPDRATVYRRLRSLERSGLVAARAEAGQGARRRVLRLTARGEEALREELREAVRLLAEAFAAQAPRRGGGKRGRADPPIVFVSGARISGVETRIVRSMARAHPRRVHLVVQPGVDVASATGAAPTLEAPWTALPFRDAYARTLFVNELPPARALAGAVREWARVLAPGGWGYVIAPAPIPRGVDPFVDFFADVQAELFPGQAPATDVPRVDEALREAFDRASRRQDVGQFVWTVRGR